VLSPEENKVLDSIKRRYLLGGVPGYVDDAEWYADEPQESERGPGEDANV
jgi:hypothetical protein